MKLYQGDCLDVLRTLPDASVDAVVTDPPYGIAYQSAWRTDKGDRFAKIANDGQPYVWWLPEAARLLCPAGCLLCFCRWDVAEAFRLAIGWAGLKVLKVGAQLVWDRGMHGLGDLSSRPAPRHDVVWFAVKGKYKFHGARPCSVLRETTVNGNALRHPTEKPVPLMAGLVRDYCPPGGTVLDPFMGSGTTGTACLREGWEFVGVELDPTYFAVAKKRLDDELALKEGRVGLFANLEGQP